MSALVQNVELGRGREANPVMTKGEGAPLVYLHGLLGQEWPGFLDMMAQCRRVLAPANVGSDEMEELKDFDGIHDLMLYYDELLDHLGLDQIDLVGHSFGGMVAAEFAASYPRRVRRLVLIDPLGLWRYDLPVGDHLYVTPDQQVALLLGDPSGDEVRRRLAEPEDPKQLISTRLRRITSLASTTHFIWPIPERGLIKRLHRINAQTLIIWGANDRFVPVAYADDFAAQIKDARIEVIADAGHAPHYDHPVLVSEFVGKFLSD